MGMRRREFIASLGSAAASAWPMRAWAQQRGKIIGFLGAGAATAWAPMVASFEQRLRELGWIDGRTVAIVYRWADGKSDRFGEIATEFVGLKVDVILTAGSAVAAAKRVTSTIPIVFAAAVDPVASGFVDSLARLGCNVTGLSLQSSDIAPKRIEILREAIPALAASRSWPMPVTRAPPENRLRSKRSPASSGSRSVRSTSTAPMISRPRSSHSRAAHWRFTCAPTR
jgi:putative tryptophan/tyrosine transport system substrate-binding protein